MDRASPKRSFSSGVEARFGAAKTTRRHREFFQRRRTVGKYLAEYRRNSLRARARTLSAVCRTRPSTRGESENAGEKRASSASVTMRHADATGDASLLVSRHSASELWRALVQPRAKNGAQRSLADRSGRHGQAQEELRIHAFELVDRLERAAPRCFDTRALCGEFLRNFGVLWIAIETGKRRAPLLRFQLRRKNRRLFAKKRGFQALERAG